MSIESIQCPICLEYIPDSCVVTTKCNHKFCAGCIVKCIKLRIPCPMCRIPIKVNADKGDVLGCTIQGASIRTVKIIHIESPCVVCKETEKRKKEGKTPLTCSHLLVSFTWVLFIVAILFGCEFYYQMNISHPK